MLVLVKRFESDRELLQLPQLAVPFARWTRLETRLPTEPLSLMIVIVCSKGMEMHDDAVQKAIDSVKAEVAAAAPQRGEDARFACPFC